MDDPTLLIVGGIIGMILWTWILYEVIKSASQSTKQVDLLKMQVRLLVKLLKHHDVDQEVINEAISPEKKR